MLRDRTNALEWIGSALCKMTMGLRKFFDMATTPNTVEQLFGKIPRNMYGIMPGFFKARNTLTIVFLRVVISIWYKQFARYKGGSVVKSFENLSIS